MRYSTAITVKSMRKYIGSIITIFDGITKCLLMDNTSNSLFYPYLYLVWTDEWLSGNEFNTFNRFINEQSWLSSANKQWLAGQLDPASPPSRETLQQWKAAIDRALLEQPDIQHLFALGLALGGDQNLVAHQPAFLQLENDLGLGEEAIAGFRRAALGKTAASKTSSELDIATVTDWFNGSQAAMINQVKTLLSQPAFAYETSTDTAVKRQKVLEWCKILARENMGNKAYPTAYGGGGDIEAYFSIMETLSYHDLSMVIKFGVQFGLWGMSVWQLGTEKHYAKWLKDIGSLALPGCFAMTETNHGSNVKGLETTATYQHSRQSFIIHTPNPKAQKEYIGNAALHGQMATVFAKLIINGKDYGVNAFVVPLRNGEGQTLPGVTIGDCGQKMGLNGVDNGTISFDQVEIPKENMLDRFARVNDAGEFESPIPSDNRRFFTMLGTLVGGRIGIPRSALSASKSGLSIAIQYSDQRRQFGPEGGAEVPILNYRMHQRRLMPKLATTYALHTALQYLTQRFLQRKEADMQEIEALAAGLKAYTTWFTRDTLQECREATGGKGYLSENRIDALKNDTEIYTTFEGDNTVLMQLVAKSRLAEFRKAFGKMDARGMIGYVFENAKTMVTEKNPMITRRTDDAHLLDYHFHLQAFEHREKTILASAARRLKKLVDGGMDGFDAANVVQHQLMDVAAAYLERVILEQFHLSIGRVQDPRFAASLTRLCQLFALSALDKDKGWFLEDGYMEPVKTKAIRKLVNQLCWDIRQEAVPLVRAFDIPAQCLSAPIVV